MDCSLEEYPHNKKRKKINTIYFFTQLIFVKNLNKKHKIHNIIPN
jgi:hypothetical protein